MRENRISFYNAHAPLDMHPEVSPSRLCAVGVTLIDAMHYGMEKPPQLAMARWFDRRGLPARFVPDGPK